MEEPREKTISPAIIGVVLVFVVLIGVLAFRAAQPPAPTPGQGGARSGVDPRNPARPPVDEHANDWHPPAGR